ncbi:MAG: 4-hydroxybenzoate octaprenyltransferase [Rhizobiales bacterium]|nr:4-hydroxybenzoate octaprenyltransferase [Hyphomicrobiales bacterium]
MLEASQTRIADAVKDHWAERMVPPALLPYAQLMRLERPVGWWLLLLPCWWGLLLVEIAEATGPVHWFFALLFVIGAIAMRGAGCTLNDIADRDFDRAVERTRQRPLASGRIGLTQAFVFLAVQCFVGLAVLLQFNWYTVVLGAASLLIVAVYPFMKRVTYWPQAVLGLAFNWGALVGWAAVAGSLSLAPLLLYAGGLMWTLAYDTIYAHQDKEDDLLIGVKSTALKFGENSQVWIGGFFAAAIMLISAAAAVAGAGLLSYLGIMAAAVQALRQVTAFDMNDPAGCLQLFRSNRAFGLLIVAGFFADTII